jgi:diaminopimelate epimerase
MVKVDMGEPVFEPGKIPVIIQNSDIGHPISPHPPLGKGASKGVIIDYPLQIADREFKITCVSMGNPHAVIVVDDLHDFPVTYYGPIIEKLSLFPKKTNVEFIEVINRTEMKMRVWERGSGETMACGTGASAAAVALNVKGLTEKKVIIHLVDGDLVIEWAGNNHVYMTGPAVEVFTGVIEY